MLKPQRKADEDDFDSDKDEFHVSSLKQEDGSVAYNIFLYGPIKDPRQFVTAIEVLMAAKESDTVIVNISTPGGDIDATDTFLQALGAASARVVFVASGGVHSAGTLILMHADEVAFSDGFNALVHNGSVGFGSKFSDWKAAAAFVKPHMEAMFHRAYRGFMTDEEISDMIGGKDFWFDAEEFSERLQKRNELLEEE